MIVFFSVMEGVVGRIGAVPADVWTVVLSHIDVNDLHRVRLVNKLFFRCSSSEAFYRLFIARLDRQYWPLFRGCLWKLADFRRRENEGSLLPEEAFQDALEFGGGASLIMNIKSLSRRCGVAEEILVRCGTIQSDLSTEALATHVPRMSTVGIRRAFIAEKDRVNTLRNADTVACIGTSQSLLETSAIARYYELGARTYWLYDGGTIGSEGPGKLECVVDRNVGDKGERKWAPILLNDGGPPERTLGFGRFWVNGLIESIVYSRELLELNGVCAEQIEVVCRENDLLLEDGACKIRIGGFPIEDPQGCLEMEPDEELVLQVLNDSFAWVSIVITRNKNTGSLRVQEACQR